MVSAVIGLGTKILGAVGIKGLVSGAATIGGALLNSKGSSSAGDAAN